MILLCVVEDLERVHTQDVALVIGVIIVILSSLSFVRFGPPKG